MRNIEGSFAHSNQLSLTKMLSYISYKENKEYYEIIKKNFAFITAILDRMVFIFFNQTIWMSIGSKIAYNMNELWLCK